MGLDFNSTAVKQNIIRAEYGMEKESLRTDLNGNLSHTLHPFVDDPNIDRDFCENQIEIISDVFDNADALLAHIDDIHNKIYSALNERKELLWPFSNPPLVKGEDDIPVAGFTGEMRSKTVYRNYLAKKYGKMKMLFSGIHFNFSFTDELITVAASAAGKNKFDFKNSIYLELAKKLVEYNWLIVYLTAASPVMDESFVRYSGFSAESAHSYASVRCSRVGYWNDFIPILGYESIEDYIVSVQKYIDAGKLKSVSELYYPVRMKPRGKNTLEGLRNGINHIELRTLDLNPLTRAGIFKEDIHFIHVLMVYLLSIENRYSDENAQIRSVLNIKRAAMFDDKNNHIEFADGSLPLREAALRELDRIRVFAQKYLPVYLYAVEYQQKKLTDGRRYAEIVKEQYSDEFVQKGIELAKSYSHAPKGAAVYV
ncbi:MAG: hypothetical protein IJ861_07950 [Clostridia bacterium]|nr:hypothetical protein [Clostridia bacterium]